jgi:PhzF family phenazine biosynthesis protein
MELTLYQVDAFTNELFKGNPAAVCPLEGEWLSEERMQAIAMENNLSETAFFHASGRDYHLRWFTPTKEVNLCGHATLASAHVLFEHLGYGDKRITFHTLSGPLMVEREGSWYAMNFPVDHLKLRPASKLIERALGMHPVEVYKGREDYLAIFDSQEQIERATPDFRRIAQLDARGLIISAPGREVDFVSRCFFPAFGINEDPVTGSAHTTLAPYWGKRLQKKELVGKQCSRRSGLLHCKLLEERVAICGQAVTYLVGRISVG